MKQVACDFIKKHFHQYFFLGSSEDSGKSYDRKTSNWLYANLKII